MIIKIFYAIFLISAGVWILKYRKVIKWWTWNFYWAEKYIWRWWTYFILVLFGMFLIFLWVIYPFGWLQSLKSENSSKYNSTNME